MFAIIFNITGPYIYMLEQVDTLRKNASLQKFFYYFSTVNMKLTFLNNEIIFNRKMMRTKY